MDVTLLAYDFLFGWGEQMTSQKCNGWSHPGNEIVHREAERNSPHIPDWLGWYGMGGVHGADPRERRENWKSRELRSGCNFPCVLQSPHRSIGSRMGTWARWLPVQCASHCPLCLRPGGILRPWSETGCPFCYMLFWVLSWWCGWGNGPAGKSVG